MAEKTEKATPKKLRDAMRKGQVAKSQDFPAAFTFIVSLAATLWMMEWIFQWIGVFTAQLLQGAPQLHDVRRLPDVMQEAVYVILKCSLPVCMVTAFMGVIVHYVSTGPVWAPEVFKPNIKKFNPIDNLKAKFEMKTFFELIKSIFKITGAGILIYFTVRRALPQLVTLCKIPLLHALIIFAHFVFEVVWQVGLFFITVAIADLIFQKRNFAKEMKMEKFEVKQEYKNTEGNPQLKSKRRQIAQEIAYQDGPLAGLKKARAVVVNPTHIAIAIGYERDEDPAPFIAAISRDYMAAAIVKEAKRLGLPILRNIWLAHELWEHGEEWEYVPEDTFEVMAQ
ncbi:MAG: flagellar type III secretion system protein FlhB, partial [Chlamydiia bacterium]|nr:flagellar type III secretion system protein FlhB [Chlamydiia bacterium]